jgi:hypothetical protein
MKLKIISLSIISLPISLNFCNDFPPIQLPNGRVVQLPNKSEFKPLPGAPTFIFNNQQILNTYEKREVQTHISKSQPPPIIINTPAQQPVTKQPESAVSDPKNQTIKTSQSSLQGLISWIKELPNNVFTLKTGAFLAGTAAVGYTILWIKFLHYTALAKKSNGWGSLQEHVPPQHLISIPLLNLAEGLIEEIKKKYIAVSLTESIPLFTLEVEEEIEELQSFLTFYEWLDYFKLSFFFPNKKKLVTRAKLKIQRLMIFNEALTQWVNANSARLIKNIEIPRSPFIFSFESTQDETDVMELPAYEE